MVARRLLHGLLTACAISAAAVLEPFDGIGAVSAGASSRLLIDYPEQARAEILDLLFLPGYGAELQVLKVEIGSGAQSTDGSEPSVDPEGGQGDVRCVADGYEFWLATEAYSRNPDIRLAALTWGAPGWTRNASTGTLFSNGMIDYLLEYCRCIANALKQAASSAGRPAPGVPHYLGIWNESPWGHADWLIELRGRLNQEGFGETRMVLLDASGNGVDPDFLKLLETEGPGGGADFMDRLAARGAGGVGPAEPHSVKLGLHYPCKVGAVPRTDRLFSLLQSPDHAQLRSLVSVWASEDYSTPADFAGAACWGRTLNQNSVRMGMTATIAWSPIWAAYPNLECFGNGLMYAFWPWDPNGYYETRLPIFVTAHTTHFTTPGRSMVTNKGSLREGSENYSNVIEIMSHAHEGVHNGSTADGTFVVYWTDGSFALVAERLRGACMYHQGCPHDDDDPHEQTIEVAVRVGRDAGAFRHVTSSAGEAFREEDPLLPDPDGLLRFSVQIDTISTVSNSTRAISQLRSYAPEKRAVRERERRRAAPLSAQAPSSLATTSATGRDTAGPTNFPLPFSQKFDDPELRGRSPPFFADQSGSFLVNSNGQLEQVVRTPPLPWGGGTAIDPWTMFGDVNWTDVRVAVKMIRSAWISPRGPSVNSSARSWLCARVARFQFFGGSKDVEGYCLTVTLESGLVELLSGGRLLQQSSLGIFSENNVTAPTLLELRVSGARIHALVNGKPVGPPVIDVMYPLGSVALGCSWHHDCVFDDLGVLPEGSDGVLPASDDSGSQESTRDEPRAAAPDPDVDVVPSSPGVGHVFQTSHLRFDYHARACTSQPTVSPLRNDFSGQAGIAFSVSGPLENSSLFVDQVSRKYLPGNNGSHEVQLLFFPSGRLGQSEPIVVATASILVAGQAADSHGWVSSRTNAKLQQRGLYVLAASERSKGDVFLDRVDYEVSREWHRSRAYAVPGLRIVCGALRDSQAGWRCGAQGGATGYGPVNLVLRGGDAAEAAAVILQ